ncbi:MAG: prolipoprotein diacylglyceryl transferase [Myxococcales bacterium]|nr:prolipoprotein diacylglyceryl transferase [Myxococcales bacterium]
MLEGLWSAARAGPWWISWETFQLLAIVAGALAIDASPRKAARGESPPPERRAALTSYACGVACACLGGVVLGSWPGVVAWLSGAAGRPELEVAGFGALAGLSLGFAATWHATSRARSFSTRDGLDRLAPAIGPMLLFARLGCFVGGCDFGAPTHAPWAMRFPAGTPAFRAQVEQGLVSPHALATLAVHPAPLYEALVGLGLFALARCVGAGRRGRRFAAVLATYAVARLFLDGLRGDLPHGVLGLTSSQVLALAALAFAAALAFTPPRPKAASTAA